MNASECKRGGKCPKLGRIYNQQAKQNNGPFICLAVSGRPLIRNLIKCPNPKYQVNK